VGISEFSEKRKSPYKFLTFYFVAFVTFYLTQAVLLNRLIDVDGLYITGGTFIYFLSPLIVDVVAEVYGYRAARQILWLGFAAIIFFSIVIAICIRTPYPPFWGHMAMAYSTALHSLARTTIVGLIATMIGQFTNIYLISKWKILCRGKYFWLRSVGSSIIGDTLTVVLAILGIFWGRIPPHAFMSILLPELIVMIVFSMVGAIPAWLLANLTAKAENLNVYDVGVNFNPFKVLMKD